MKTLKFKTNINCSNCINAVTPHLDKAAGIKSWSVDTDNPDKILSVESESAEEAQVVKVLQKAGFKAEPIPEHCV